MTDKEIFEWLMQSRPPIRRTGSLNKVEVAEAVTAYQANGRALLEDALLLAYNNRVNRAIALAVLAIEEIAKVSMLSNAFRTSEVENNTSNWDTYWKVAGRHGDKQEHILLYGSIIQDFFRGDIMHDRRLYRYYAPKELSSVLDHFKQSNLYVDLRMDGVHAPQIGPFSTNALDFLMTYAQERSDSFQSWHVSVKRSLDFLSINPLDRKPWTSSHHIDEVCADLQYQMSAMSASIVPDYGSFKDYVQRYRHKVSERRLKDALLDLCKLYNSRLQKSKALERYYGRQFGQIKLLLSLESFDGHIFGKRFGARMKELLLSGLRQGDASA